MGWYVEHSPWNKVCGKGNVGKLGIRRGKIILRCQGPFGCYCWEENMILSTGVWTRKDPELAGGTGSPGKKVSRAAGMTIYQGVKWLTWNLTIWWSPHHKKDGLTSCDVAVNGWDRVISTYIETGSDFSTVLWNGLKEPVKWAGSVALHTYDSQIANHLRPSSSYILQTLVTSYFIIHN